MKISLALTLMGLLLSACGGSDGGSGSRDTVGLPDAGVDFGAWDTAADGPQADQNAADPGPGDPGGQPDAAEDGLQPLDIPADLPKGDAGFGEPCSTGGDCQSGLCFATSAAAGCTVACASHAECAEWGLICQWLGGDVRGCVPPLVDAAVPCTDSSACPWPTLCRTDLGQCELDPGHCAWDGDCPAAQACEPVVRVCRPSACQGDPECMNPRLVCRDGQCVEPECTTDAACGAGKYCQAGACQPAEACDADGKCSFYNLMCVNDACVPNRCVTPCSKPGDVCDATTGKCGAACTAPAQCGAGKTCLAGGVCVANGAPFAAARFRLGGQLVPAGDVALGPAIPLDGSQSFDPDGDTLTYRWVINASPFGSGKTPGTALSPSVTAELVPDVAGLYAFGLWVTDAAGAVSFQDQVVVRVW